MNPNLVKKTPVNFLLKLWFGNLWISRTVAIIASVNLLLVVFDLSYVSWRDFWFLGKVRVLAIQLGWFKNEGINLKILPESLTKIITQNYDPIKGIEPHRETEAYLKTVSQLEANLYQLDSPYVAKILERLRQETVEMIQTNPFQLANKSGNLERIKNLMRKKVPNPNNSAQQSFRIFWTPDYLREDTVSKINFFNSRIKPLMVTNFFRRIDENGNFTDYFNLIDFPFFVLFLVDFLGRTLYTSRLNPGVKWRVAMLWRWYDILFLIPYFRILRVIPVTVRLNETKLINLELVQREIIHGLVSAIAIEMTEVIILRVINRLEESIEEGSVFEKLLQSSSKEYIDLNGRDEMKEILTLILQFTLGTVLPKVRPDLQILLEYTIQKSLQNTSLYKQLQLLPGFERLGKKVVAEIIDNLFVLVSANLKNMLKEDLLFETYLKNVQVSLFKSIATLESDQTLPQLKHWIKVLLQEIKINYTNSLKDQEIKQFLVERNAIVNQDN